MLQDWSSVLLLKLKYKYVLGKDNLSIPLSVLYEDAG